MSLLTKPMETISNWMSPAVKNKKIFFFNEGSLEDKQFLSTKGAHICEISRLGLPVPTGFIMSTDAAYQYQAEGNQISEGLFSKIANAVLEIERKTGKVYGGSNATPLVLCLRSGALVSMSEQAHTSIGAPESWKVPGVMSTILGVGLNDAVVDNLSKLWNARSALNVYAHFLMSFGILVYGIPSLKYHSVIRQIASSSIHIASTASSNSHTWTTEDLVTMISEFKKIQAVPTDVWTQIRTVLNKIYASWFSESSVVYRDNLEMYRGSGIAVIVNEQILGGSGVFSTRSPITGEHGLFGFYWPEASGDKISMEAFGEKYPSNYQQLLEFKCTLELKFRDMQDIEFAMDSNDKIWILNSMPGHRRPIASVRIAMSMIREGILTERNALLKIDPFMLDKYARSQLGVMEATVLTPETSSTTSSGVANNKGTAFTSANVLAGKGTAASDGLAIGYLAFTLEDCMNIVAEGKHAIYCKDDCDISDINAIKLSAAVITIRGSATSPTAIFCRGLNKVCVTGVGNMSISHVNDQESLLTAKGILHSNDVLTVNGATGAIYVGEAKIIQQVSDKEFDEIVLLAQKYRRLQAFGYAKTLPECQQALDNHADGAAILQTEWMFQESVDRLNLVRGILFGATESDRQSYYNHLENYLVNDFRMIYKASALASREGAYRPIMVQLFDGSLDDFLPVSDADTIQLATAINLSVKKLKHCVAAFNYKTKYTGISGKRAHTALPDLIALQVRAIIKAVNLVNSENKAALEQKPGLTEETLEQVEQSEESKAMDAISTDAQAGSSTRDTGDSNNADSTKSTGSIGASSSIPTSMESAFDVNLPFGSMSPGLGSIATSSNASIMEFTSTSGPNVYHKILPLILLPLTSTWQEVQRLTSLLQSIAKEFMITPAKPEGEALEHLSAAEAMQFSQPKNINDILNIGLLVGTPRACINIEEFLAPEYNISFVCFQCDILTEYLYGMAKEDFLTLSPGFHVYHHYASVASYNGGQYPTPLVSGTGNASTSHTTATIPPSDTNKVYYADRNPFIHLDEKGVGTAIEQCVKQIRRMKKRNEIKIGVAGDIVCSDAGSIKFLNRLDIDYIACHANRVEVACLAAAQAQISDPNAPARNYTITWEGTDTTHTSSTAPSHYDSTFLRIPLRDIPFINLWKNAERQAGSYRTEDDSVDQRPEYDFDLPFVF